MALARDMTIKPTCLRELYGLSQEMAKPLWEKIEYLARDPLPDGKFKKKLNVYKDVYRMRVGDYRIFYSFGSNWIRLLTVRPRKDAYDQDVAYEEPPVTFSGPDPEIEEDEELAAGTPAWQQGSKEPTGVEPLPSPITVELLNRLRVPAEYHAALLHCATADDLLSAPVPGELLDVVLDNLIPRPVTEILQQPNLVVNQTQDLVRYCDGDLLGFLLQLDSEQERLVDATLLG